MSPNYRPWPRACKAGIVMAALHPWMRSAVMAARHLIGLDLAHARRRCPRHPVSAELLGHLV